MRTLVILLATLSSAVPAGAQAPASDAFERHALRVGILATVIPVAAGVAVVATQQDDGPGFLFAQLGLLLGPAFGYQEAGRGGRGWRGAGLRTGLALGSFIGAVAVCWDCTRDQERAAKMVAAGGGVLVAAAAIYDLARLRHNMRRREAKRRLSIVPWGMGVRATVSF